MTKKEYIQRFKQKYEIDPYSTNYEGLPLVTKEYSDVVNEAVERRAKNWNRDCATRYGLTLLLGVKDLIKIFRENKRRKPSLVELSFMKLLVTKNALTEPLFSKGDGESTWDPLRACLKSFPFPCYPKGITL